MNAGTNDSTGGLPGRFRQWYGPLVLLLFVFIALGCWLLPRRISDIVSISGDHRWSADEAPLRRNIVWPVAEPVDPPAPVLAARDSLIRPQLAAGGTVLYFTLRKPGEGADIYRSRQRDGVWQPAEAVAQLNSEADDIGPVIRADGKQLYLYSDRPGGMGGFDLYVSQRTESGWSQPESLGRQVNSPAHEYDPAISADGRRLFFASNRSPRLQRRLQENKLRDPQQPWTSTLRADLGLHTFDLYEARRAQSDDEFETAVALDELNNQGTNEGAPFVSRSGDFLYFVSDRPQRPDEEANFDILRARIYSDRVAKVENLGPGVNTPLNEIEPSLSPEGYRIFFSRNRPAAPDQPAAEQQYTLYASTAVEVEQQAGWDNSHWHSLVAAIARFFGQNGWWLLLALLLLALLASLFWFFQSISLRRVRVPVFLLIALLIHLLLGAGSFFVYFGDVIVEKIKQLEQQIVATEVLLEDSHRSQEPEDQQPYEKIADLQNVETVQPADVHRQVTEMPNVPQPTHTPVPSVPTPLTQERPQPDRPATSLPQQVSPPRPEMARQTTEIQQSRETVELQQSQVVQQTAERQPERMRVDISRQQPAPQVAAVPQVLERRTVELQLGPAEALVEKIPEQPVEPATESPSVPLQRNAVAQTEAPETPNVETETLQPAAAPQAETQPQNVPVQVARKPVTNPATAPEVRPTATQMEMKIAKIDVTDQRPTPQAVPATPDQPAQIERTSQTVEQAADAPQVPTEAVAGPVREPTPEPQLSTAAVNVQRQPSQPAALSAPQVASAARTDAAVELNPIEMSVERPDAAQPVPSAVTREQVTLSRNPSRTAERPSESPVVQTEAAAAPASAPPAPSEPARLAVSVSRQSDSGPTSLADELAKPNFASPRAEFLAGQLPSDEAPVKPAAAVEPTSGPVTLALARADSAAKVASDVVDSVTTVSPAQQAESTRPGEFSALAAVVQVERTADSRQDPQPSSTLKLAAQSAGGPQPATDPIDATAGSLAAIAQPRSQAVAVSGLQRTRSVAGQVAGETIATDETAAAQPPAAATAPSIAGVSVGISRPASEVVQFEVASAGPLGGRFNPQNPRLVLGSLDKESVDAPLASSPLASRITLKPARAPRVLYAEDNIGLQSLLRLRMASPDLKTQLVEKYGGADLTLQAVHRGLSWIEVHQFEDGRWSLDQFTRRCDQHDGKCKGHGNTNSDTAATALALLPFLGDGHTHKAGKYQQLMTKGLWWLISSQKPDGDLFTGGDGNNRMYSHGLATIALCEAYGMSKDESLRAPAQKAIDFIVKAQHKEGGWRYQPGQPGDTSVVGWQVMALKSGQMAELDVPQKTLDQVKKYLDQVRDAKGQFGYQRNGQKTPAMTAEALLCLEYLGVPSNNPYLVEGGKFLLKNLPRKGKDTSYYWYYGTQVMFHLQGDHWQQWNDALNRMLVDTQVTKGPMAGTWDPHDRWEGPGGRIMSTSLRLLMLEVYYRHLPLYQTLEQ